jgi:hypothetical protein
LPSAEATVEVKMMFNAVVTLARAEYPENRTVTTLHKINEVPGFRDKLETSTIFILIEQVISAMEQENLPSG